MSAATVDSALRSNGFVGNKMKIWFVMLLLSQEGCAIQMDYDALYSDLKTVDIKQLYPDLQNVDHDALHSDLGTLVATPNASLHDQTQSWPQLPSAHSVYASRSQSLKRPRPHRSSNIDLENVVTKPHASYYDQTPSVSRWLPSAHSLHHSEFTHSEQLRPTPETQVSSNIIDLRNVDHDALHSDVEPWDFEELYPSNAQSPHEQPLVLYQQTDSLLPSAYGGKDAVARPHASSHGQTRRSRRLPSAHRLLRSESPSPKRRRTRSPTSKMQASSNTPAPDIPEADIPEATSEVLEAFKTRYSLSQSAAEVLWYLATLKQKGVVDAEQLVKRTAKKFNKGRATTYKKMDYPNGVFTYVFALKQNFDQRKKSTIGRHKKPVDPLFKAAESDEVVAAITLGAKIQKALSRKIRKSETPEMDAFKKHYCLNAAAAKVLRYLVTLKQKGVVDAEQLVKKTAKIYNEGHAATYKGVYYANGAFSNVQALLEHVVKTQKTGIGRHERDVNLYKAAESEEVAAAIQLGFNVHNAFYTKQNRGK